VWAAVAVGFAAGGARAAEPPDEPPRCDLPQSERAPDPRCGERLDGRPPEPPPTAAHNAGQAALWLPKGVAKVAVWPIVKTADVVESNNLQGWYQALLTSDDGRVGVRPELAFATGFAPTVGARVFYRRLPGEGTELSARAVGGLKVLIGQLQLRLPTFTGLTVSGTYEHRGDRLFAGIGPNSESDLQARGQTLARYSSDILRGDVVWFRALPGRLYALVHGDVQRRDYGSTDVRGSGPSVAEAFGLPPAECMTLGRSSPCVNPAEMPGFYAGQRMAHGGLSLGFDGRSRLRGGSGVNGNVDATLGAGIGSDPTRDVRLSGEAVGALAGTDRVLLVRGWAAMVESIGDAILPFEELITPSGIMGMRGFPEGRFRGQSAVVGTLEYRYYIAWTLDASVFADMGTVAGSRFQDLGASRWFPNFGLGFRFYNPHGPHWEAPVQSGVQVTYAPDYGARLLLSLAGF
jgi:hypothetical protein